jgi:TolB-like protein
MGANDRTTVIPLVLPRPVAEELIHRLAREGQYVIEPVCMTKMRERKFTARQVMTTIEEGHINQGPVRDECGDWRCRMRKRVAGRDARVVLAINSMNFLYLISVH